MIGLRSFAFACACWAATRHTAFAFPRAKGSVSLQSTSATDVEGTSLADSMLEHIIVIPEHRLLFCTIPGVEAEAFNGLFRDVRRFYLSRQNRTKEVEISSNRYWQHGYSVEDLRRVFKDPTWHKAAFVREPIERFVLMFQKTCGSKNEVQLEKCKLMFGTPPRDLPQAVNRFRKGMTFDPNSVTNENDPYLVQQVQLCGGLGKTAHNYNTIVQVKPGGMHQAVTSLLSRTGIPAKFSERPLAKFFPEETEVFHKMKPLFPPEHAQWMIHTLLARYSADYKQLGIALPHWIDDILGPKRGRPASLYALRPGQARVAQLSTGGIKGKAPAAPVAMSFKAKHAAAKGYVFKGGKAAAVADEVN